MFFSLLSPLVRRHYNRSVIGCKRRGSRRRASGRVDGFVRFDEGDRLVEGREFRFAARAPRCTYRVTFFGSLGRHCSASTHRSRRLPPLIARSAVQIPVAGFDQAAGLRSPHPGRFGCKPRRPAHQGKFCAICRRRPDPAQRRGQKHTADRNAQALASGYRVAPPRFVASRHHQRAGRRRNNLQLISLRATTQAKRAARM